MCMLRLLLPPPRVQAIALLERSVVLFFSRSRTRRSKVCSSIVVRRPFHVPSKSAREIAECQATSASLADTTRRQATESAFADADATGADAHKHSATTASGARRTPSSHASHASHAATANWSAAARTPLRGEWLGRGHAKRDKKKDGDTSGDPREKASSMTLAVVQLMLEAVVP